MVNIALDKDTQRQLLSSSQWYYFDLHQGELFNWVQDNFDQHSYLEARNYFYDNPYIGYLLLKQQELNNEKKEELVINELMKPGKIHIVVGSKGSGKTCLSYYLASKITEKNKQVWFFGPPTDVPSFITGTTLNFSKIPNDALTIIDEASVQFFNATSRSEKLDVIRLLPVIRHSNQSFIVITQNTALMDVNFLRTADSIIFKTPSILQSISEGHYERIRISEVLSTITPRKISSYLFYNDKHLLLLDYSLPLWWKQSYSTPYAPFTSRYAAYVFIIKALEELDNTEIVTQLTLKKFFADEYLVEYIRELYNENKNLLNLPPAKLVRLIEKGFDATSIQELMKGKQDSDIVEFKLSPIQQITDEEIEFKARKKVNLFFLNEIKHRQKTQGNVIISISGYPGTGKSWGALALSQILNQIYKCNNTYIVFSAQELLDLLENAPRGSTFIMDEQVTSWGEGSSREQQEIMNVENTIRKEQINFIWVSPIPKPHQDFFNLITWGINYSKKKSRFLVYSGGKLFGHIILSEPPAHIVKNYETKKDDFIKQVKTRKTSSSRYNFDEMIKKIVQEQGDLWNNAKSLKQKMLVITMVFPNMTYLEKEMLANYSRLKEDNITESA